MVAAKDALHLDEGHGRVRLQMPDERSISVLVSGLGLEMLQAQLLELYEAIEAHLINGLHDLEVIDTHSIQIPGRLRQQRTNHAELLLDQRRAVRELELAQTLQDRFAVCRHRLLQTPQCLLRGRWVVEDDAEITNAHLSALL